MPPVRCLLLYVAFVLLGGALLAPWLFLLAHWAGEQVSALQPLARNPFPKFVTRAFMLLALAGLWPVMRCVGGRSWSNVGLCRPRGQMGRLAAGFALGTGSLALAALIAVAAGARGLRAGLTTQLLLSKIAGAALTAAGVGFIEELLFRGALFGAWRKVQPWPVALAGSSVLYALVHFLHRPSDPGIVTWLSGFTALAQMGQDLVQPRVLLPGVLTLTLIGVILGLAYQRTNNLYFSIGLHAGWVFWLKLYGAITVGRTATAGLFWGTGRLVDGWLALLVLLPVLAVVVGVPRRHESTLHAAKPHSV